MSEMYVIKIEVLHSFENWIKTTLTQRNTVAGIKVNPLFLTGPVGVHYKPRILLV